MTAATSFYDSPPGEQINRLTALARAALPEWGLENAELTTVAYRENMTFRVDAGGRAYALRIHQGNYRTDAQIQSELDLMTYLDSEGIHTPKVVPAAGGALFTTVSADGVDEPRQVDLFEWIDGKPLRMTGQPFGDIHTLAESYVEVGRLCARIYNATEKWQTPPGFERIAWDEDGMFGTPGVIGDFRNLRDLPESQVQMLNDVAGKLAVVLGEFGKSPDRYGLSQGDFLGENIFVTDDGLRLLDFDDAGDSWCLFDIATAVFDFIGTPAFDPCLAATVRGYREHRDLPDEHLELIPAFILGRLLSYLGWCAKKTHMPQTAVIQPLLLAAVEQQAPAFLGR